MQQNLFSTLESLLSVPATSGTLLVCDVTGAYRAATEYEVLHAAQLLLGAKVIGSDVLGNPRQVTDFLRLRLGGLNYEMFAVVHLNSQHRVLQYVEMFRGTVSSTSVYPRELVRDAIEQNSSAVILVHNHPSGNTKPSRADESLTQTVKQALALIDVRVIDHIIVGPQGVFSMAGAGLI